MITTLFYQKIDREGKATVGQKTRSLDWRSKTLVMLNKNIKLWLALNQSGMVSQFKACFAM